MLKEVRSRVEAGWTTTKKLLAALSAWGLIFSVVTISRFGVAFDYDDTLVFSTPAFSKAFRGGSQPFSPAFWAAVNTSYDLERRKVLPNTLAWLFRVCGFKITILAGRPSYEGDALRKEWRHLSKNFAFADKGSKHALLQSGGHVLYFADSDSDIMEGRKARVLTLRVKRSPKSSYKEDYNPGSLRELVLPFTEY